MAQGNPVLLGKIFHLQGYAAGCLGLYRLGRRL